MKKKLFILLAMVMSVVGVNAQVFDTIVSENGTIITDDVWKLYIRPENKLEGTEELIYIETKYKDNIFLIYADKELRFISPYQLDWNYDKYMGDVVSAYNIDIVYCDNNANIIKELKVKLFGGDNLVNWRTLDAHKNVMYLRYEMRAYSVFDNLKNIVVNGDNNFMRLRVKTYSHGTAVMIVKNSPLLQVFFENYIK